MVKDKCSRYKNEEKYIIQESTEISVGESPYFRKIANLFPAWRNRNYRLYFIGQSISMIGTWLQMVAQGWLVLQLTNSAFLIGLVAALATLPMLLFSLFGGVIVDRFPKKNILLFTQTVSMILAFVLGILTILKVINVWEICVLAFLLGVVNALDAPARQSFVPELVTKEQLSSGIALNAAIYNSARVIGPGLAGFLIALVGTGGAFILNGISFIAVVIALLMMKVPLYVPKRHLHPLAAIKEGIHYSFSHPMVANLLVFVAVTSIFGWSYGTIMPVIAQNVFHLGAAGLGYLFAINGLGSLLATIGVSVLANKLSPIAVIVGGNTFFALTLYLFTFTHNLPLASFLLFLSGFGLILQFATLNTVLQNVITNEVRGRVMSIYTLMFLGLAPLGNLQIGWLSEKFGPELAIQVGTVIVLGFGLIIFFRRKKIAAAYARYREHNSLS